MTCIFLSLASSSRSQLTPPDQAERKNTDRMDQFNSNSITLRLPRERVQCIQHFD